MTDTNGEDGAYDEAEALLDTVTEFRKHPDRRDLIDFRDRLRSEWDVDYYAYGSDHD